MNSFSILSIIFVIIMIPNISIYIYHSNHEFHESEENKEKGFIEIANEQRAEGIFFAFIAIGYIICTIIILIKPENTISYYAILVGTIVIIIIYYSSKTIGFPVPDGFDYWMIDNSTNWKDNITKIAQQMFVIPLAMMLQRVYDIREFREVLQKFKK